MNTIRCPYRHEDCHQAIGIGKVRCKLLTNPIAGEECPFYKTEAQVEEGRQKAHERLKAIDRMDLVQQYEYNPARTW